MYERQDDPAWPLLLDRDLFTVWAVYSFQGVIDNGGFEFFFERDWPEGVSYAAFRNALRAIGAHEVADKLQAAENLFPFPAPERHLESRREFLAGPDSSEALRSLEKLSVEAIREGPFTYHKLSQFVRRRLLGPNVENGR
ncbi:MAG: DUF4375 domain-containing protein [Planctomycetota bacterium]